MESTVEIDASFSNVAVADVDIAITSKNGKRCEHDDVLFDWCQSFDVGTLKRNAPVPRLDLSKSDLVRLLSYLEGELQARDIVIAALKSEKAKQLLYQAKYGHLNLNDPFSALQRDSESSGECEDFNESSIGKLYENQLAYLERLIGIQRRSHQHAKQVLSFVEKRHGRIVRELEQERRWRVEDVVQGDNICVILENERERMQVELQIQRQEYHRMQAELVQTKQAMSKEKERHKAIVLYLQEEYERLFSQVEVYQRQGLPNGHAATDNFCEFDSVRQEMRLLRDHLKNEKEQVDDLKRVVRKQENELIALRRQVSIGGSVRNGNITNADLDELKMDHGRSNGTTNCLEEMKNGMNGYDSDPTETTSIGVNLCHPQQLFHASGVLRRSSSAVTSQAQSKGGVLSAAKNYISNAAKNASGRRLASSVSPPLKRWGHIVETSSSGEYFTPPTPVIHSIMENGTSEKKSSSPDAVQVSKSHEGSPNDRQTLNGHKSKMVFTSTLGKHHRDDVEPEIAELEAVLKSLALAANVSTGPGIGYVHFPDDVDALSEIGKENGLVKKDVTNGSTAGIVNGSGSSDIKIISGSQSQTSSVNSTPVLARSNSANTELTGSVGGEKRNKMPRIPVGINRKSSKGQNGILSQDQTSRIPSSSADQIYQNSDTNGHKKSIPAGCSSPHLALQRKVKAISGLANRLQKRVVAGVVNQVAVRQRSNAENGKEEPKSS